MLAAGVGAPEGTFDSSAQPEAAWAHALVVFAGPGGDSDLPARLRARGMHVTAIDTKIGGYRHDVTRPVVANQLESDVSLGLYDAVFIATPGRDATAAAPTAAAAAPMCSCAR